MSLQRIINESSTTQQGNINVLEISTKQIVVTNVCIGIIERLSKILPRIINDESMKQQRNISVLMTITLETSTTFTVCIQFFVVSSMFLKRIMNESSLKEHWNMNDSEVNTSKTIKIKKIPSKLSMFQICLAKESSTNHRWSSKETSMFWRLAQNKFCH